MSLADELAAVRAEKQAQEPFYPDYADTDLKKQLYDVRKEAIEQKGTDRQAQIMGDVQAEREAGVGSGKQRINSFVAGTGNELKRIGRNVADMAGVMSEEDVIAGDEEAVRQNLLNPNVNPDSGYYTGGKVLGDVTAALPITAALRGGAVPILARALPSLAAKAGTSSAITGGLSSSGAVATALAEGGLVGATQANAGERGRTGATSAGVNAVVDTALRSLSRGTIRGVGIPSAQSKKLRESLDTNTTPQSYLPLAQSVGEGGVGNSIARSVMNVTGVFPAAKDALQAQAKAVGRDTNELLLRRYFPGTDRAVSGVKELRKVDENNIPIGDMGDAIDASRASLKSGNASPLTANQTPIFDAASKTPLGQFTPQQLAKEVQSGVTSANQAARNVDSPAFGSAQYAGKRPLKEITNTLEATTGQPLLITDLATRQMSGKAVNLIADIGDRIGSFAGKLPVVSFITRKMATPSFQNWLMGSTKWQKALQESMKSGKDTGAIIKASQAAVAAFNADASETSADERLNVLGQSGEALSEISNRLGAVKDAANPFN